MAIWRIPLRAGAEGENVEKRESLRQKDRIPNEFESVCFFCRPIFLFRLGAAEVKEWDARRGKADFLPPRFQPAKI